MASCRLCALRVFFGGPSSSASGFVFRVHLIESPYKVFWESAVSSVIPIQAAGVDFLPEDLQQVVRSALLVPLYRQNKGISLTNPPKVLGMTE